MQAHTIESIVDAACVGVVPDITGRMIRGAAVCVGGYRVVCLVIKRETREVTWSVNGGPRDEAWVRNFLADDWRQSAEVETGDGRPIVG